MPHALFLTTWPTSMGQGSGTALFVNSLKRAVEQTGSSVTLLNPPLDTSDYAQFTLERLWYNIQLADDPQITSADWILGLDYDGFALPRRPSQPFIGTARTVFADLVRTEPEPFRTLPKTQAFFEKKNFTRCDWIATPSQYSKARIVEHYGIAPENIHVVPNGIHLDVWDGHLAALPPPDPARRPTVLAVSKLYPRKKIDVLLRATLLIRERFPDVDVRIVGGGFEWERLRALSEEIGAAPNVTWLGDVNDRRTVVAEYLRCHVFTHTSIQEGFCNVCMEAMATHRPVVTADAGPMPEMMNSAGSGFIVPPEDPEALADALCRLLDDADLRTRLGDIGRRFTEHMTWDATAARFLDLLHKNM